MRVFTVQVHVLYISTLWVSFIVRLYVTYVLPTQNFIYSRSKINRIIIVMIILQTSHADPTILFV